MMRQIQKIGFYTLVRKEIVRVFRIWPQTLLPSVMTTTLYFLVFGSFIGNRIGEFDGIPYIRFIVPGLIMMGMITNAYTNVVSSVFSAKFQNNIEELLVSPLSNSNILLGYVSGGVLRSLIVGILVTIVSLLFSPMQILYPGLVILTMILTSLFFALAGFINAVYARKFDDIAIVPTFILSPLTYLGGVFYSIEVLPEFWQRISLANPVLYLVNIFRFGFLGQSDVSILGSVLGLMIAVAVLWGIALRLLNRGVGIRK